MGSQPSKVEQVGFRPSDFVHLHNHSHYSLLDGMTKIPDLITRSKELGMNAAAVTDHGTMSGIIEFYKEAVASDFKPVIGIEAYIAARSRLDRDPSKDKIRYHLTILAQNNQGYRNLMQLISLAEIEGKYYKPRMDHEIIEKYNEGLIVLSGCASSEIGEALKDDDYNKAREIALWYKSVFGDRYYLEIQDHGHKDAPGHWDVQAKINDGVMKLAKELDLELVLTCDGHYLMHNDREAHEILLCVGTGSFLSDERRMSLEDFELHLTDPKDLVERWGKVCPSALQNTRKIADMCNVDIELDKILIPRFPTPNGESEKEYLDHLVYRGMAVRYLDKTPDEALALSDDQVRAAISDAQRERLDMELGVLDSMGYNGYFLIVQDFINWGKAQGIVFGPGRGSAAGSIIAYALNITDLDPLKYDLLFERFLNPDRVSMPDIDIDIQDTRREEVVEYCTRKYGSTRVANIVTFGKMAARAAVRDVARVLQVPYAEADRLSKMIPAPIQGHHIPLAKSIIDDADLKQEYENNPTSKRVIDYAIKLEGTIRSHGVHAAGVVIAPDDLVKFVPLEMAQKGVIATQYPKGPVEELGLLKMDFLGLSNLTIINNALRIIRKVNKVEIDLAKLPLDDEMTYKLLQEGDTTGVFQLESAGMKRYLKMLRPNVFEDIIAMVALYRPGPMQFIESFIHRKHGEEDITYLAPEFENALKQTYGTMVYQEQFMQISKEWCGFTGGQADTLRKAVGKKKIDIMRKMKVEFIDGAVRTSGAKREVAEKFWLQLEEFANYCFNKAHAACYGLIAYWTAYLKAHYPEAFMAALMTSDQGNIDRLAVEIAECRRMGIEVLAPDVSESFVEFAVVPDKHQIRFGMVAIKGVGTGAVEEILRARSESPFVSLDDIASRVSSSLVNRKAWESLVKAGAFDRYADRSDILFNLDEIIAYVQKTQKEKLSGQTDLFGNLIDGDTTRASLEIRPAPSHYTTKEQLLWERELMGLYISAHPLDDYDKFFEEQMVSLASISPRIDGQSITVGGIVTSLRSIVTKSGKKMAFVAIEDRVSDAEIIVFPSLYEKVGTQLRQDVVIKVTGRVSARDRDGNLTDDAKLIAEEITIVSDKELRDYESTGRKMLAPSGAKPQPRWRKKQASAELKVTTYRAPESVAPPVVKAPRTLYLRVDNPNDTALLMSLKSTCSDYPGSDNVVLVLGEQKKALRMPFKVNLVDVLHASLASLLGDSAVIVK